MSFVSAATVVALVFARLVLASRHNFVHRDLHPRDTVLPDFNAPVTARDGSEIPPYNTTFYFDQLIDHNNPTLGTFKQRYWFTYEFYESGGPVIIMTPGQSNAEYYITYLTNTTIAGMIAQHVSGVNIVLEHRFVGQSFPYTDFTGKNYSVLTLEQAIDDYEYFAKNVKLSMPDGNNLGPDKAPWIVLGSSYGGALAAYTMASKPGLFWAGYASSAIVQTIDSFWQYFEPIRQYMPRNCSADVVAVIAHFDEVASSNNTTAIENLKADFGMAGLVHLDDLADSLRSRLFDWQSLQPSSGPGGAFYEFCDVLEVKNGVSAPAEGWGLDHAYQSWAKLWRDDYVPSLNCGDSTIEECVGTYDPTQDYYKNSLDKGRFWWWMQCSQIGFWQTGPSQDADVPAIVSRILQPDWFTRQCQYFFSDIYSAWPDTESIVKDTNAKYGGVSLQADRLLFVNGRRDPWLYSTVSAPGVNRQSTESTPIILTDGFHGSDVVAEEAVDPTIDDAQKQTLSIMQKWLAEWPASA